MFCVEGSPSAPPSALSRPPHTLSHLDTHTHDTHPKKHRKKGLLNAVHLGMVASLVPDGKDIDYRGLLSKVQG